VLATLNPFVDFISLLMTSKGGAENETATDLLTA
jgi:hypothetical protein